MAVEALWFLLVGMLLMFVALARGPIARLPLTGAMIYLAVGVIVGPGCLGLVHPELAQGVGTLSVVAEAGLASRCSRLACTCASRCATGSGVCHCVWACWPWRSPSR